MLPSGSSRQSSTCTGAPNRALLPDGPDAARSITAGMDQREFEGLTALLRRRGELAEVLRSAEGALHVSLRVEGRSACLSVTTTGPEASRRRETVYAWLGALPGVRRELNAVVLPMPDLRGRRLGIVALRIVQQFPSAFEPFYSPRTAGLGGRQEVPETEWDEVRRGLDWATASLVAEGSAIEVDGYRSRALDPVVERAIDEVLRRDDDADVDAFLERLTAPVEAPVHPDAARLRARLRELASRWDPGRHVLQFEQVPVGEADPRGTWLNAPGYLEEGQEWPTYQGDDMTLVLQAARGGPIPLPEGVALLQIFVGFDTPWTADDDALHLRTFAELHPERAVPPPVRPSVCWRISPRPDGNLPPHFVMSELEPPGWDEAADLCAELAPLDPPDAWAEVESERVKEPRAWSMVGPLPRWFGDPVRELHAPGLLVVQLGSLAGPELHWGQGGAAYLFHVDGRWEWIVQDG